MAFALTIGMVATAGVRPVPKAQADNWLQDVPRLEGYHIYFSESAGESSRFDRSGAGLSRLAGLLELLGADLYTLEWRNGIPADANLVVIAGPAADLPPEQIAWLWTYLQDGGHLLLLADPIVGASKAFKAKSGLFQLMWDNMGLRGREDVVVSESGEIRQVIPPTPKPKADEPTPTPPAAVEVPVLITELIASSVNTLHPVGTGLTGGLKFFGARSIEVDTAPRQSQVTPLVYSDSTFYGESDFATYLQSGYVQFNIDTDTTRTNLALAAAMENIASGTRIVFIGDREFATNGGGLQTSPAYSASFLYPDNPRFLVNAIAWLLNTESNASQLTFPTPGPTGTPTTTPSPTPSPEPSATPTLTQ
jgi:hypothetical protein